MATMTSAALTATNVTDANFRLWCTFVRDTFLLGWIQTGDAGQMNFATVLTPAAGNTKQGYAIFRMDDALQATSPVYIRVDFGGGATAVTVGMWITIGTGSDGAGNITTKRFDGGATAAPTVTWGSSSAAASTSFGSAANNRVHVGLFATTGTTQIIMNIERTKDSSGADTGDGLYFYYNNTTNMNKMLYVVLGSATQPTAETGFQYVLSTNNPSSFGGEIGIAIPIPMKGYGQPPGYGLVIVRSSDFGSLSSFSVTMYGTAITYQQMGALTVINATGSADGTSRVAIRYD